MLDRSSPPPDAFKIAQQCLDSPDLIGEQRLDQRQEIVVPIWLALEKPLSRKRSVHSASSELITKAVRCDLYQSVDVVG